MLEESIRKYQNRAIETAQILQELIDLASKCAKPISAAKILASLRELAFYDALEVNDSASRSSGTKLSKPSPAN